jgi:hypothetical protein
MGFQTLHKLANMAASGIQFSCPLDMGGHDNGSNLE